MANVKTTTNRYEGGVTGAVVAVRDDKRKYIGLYAQSGSCLVSLGEVMHTNNQLTLAQGNLFETAVNVLDRILYSGAGTVLLVIQDVNSDIVLNYMFTTLTYDSEPIAYNRNRKPIVF